MKWCRQYMEININRRIWKCVSVQRVINMLQSTTYRISCGRGNIINYVHQFLVKMVPAKQYLVQRVPLAWLHNQIGCYQPGSYVQWFLTEFKNPFRWISSNKEVNHYVRHQMLTKREYEITCRAPLLKGRKKNPASYYQRMILIGIKKISLLSQLVLIISSSRLTKNRHHCGLIWPSMAWWDSTYLSW